MAITNADTTRRRGRAGSRRDHGGPGLLLAALALAAAALACSQGGGDPTVVGGAGPQPPTLTNLFAAGGRPKSGTIGVPYQLADADRHPATVAISWSSDGGATWRAASRAPGEGEATANLSTSPEGDYHLFSWSSAVDLPGVTAQARLRLLPSDQNGAGRAVETDLFTVDNSPAAPPTTTTTAPNSPPLIKSIAEPTRGATVTASPVNIVYTVVDAEGDPVNLSVMYWNGVAWNACREVAGPPSEGAAGLSASAAGDTHTFVWDVAQDMPNAALQVTVRLFPSNASLGPPLSTDFIVNLTSGPPGTPPPPPNQPPEATGITAPAAGSVVRSSPVVVTWQARDADGDPVGVKVERWAGAAWASCTEDKVSTVPAASEGVANLSTSPAGTVVSHTFLWNAAQDLGANANAQTYLRVTPSDAAVGAPYAQAAPITVQLGSTGTVNAAPTATAITKPAVGATEVYSPVLVEYTVSDAEGDPVSVLIEAWTGTAWRKCAEDVVTTTPVKSDGVANLATSAAGTGHRFLWDATTDLGAGAYVNAYIRITPSDAKAGAAASTNQPGFYVQLPAGGGAGVGPGGPLFATVGAPTPSTAANVSGGQFAAPMIGWKSGLYAQDVAVGDLNLDGYADFALCDGNSSDLLVYHGNGSGTPALAAKVPCGLNGSTVATNKPRTVIIADFNKDQWPDLAVVCTGSKDFTVIVNQGAGKYVANNIYLAMTRKWYDKGYLTPQDLCAADFDGDGNVDLAVVNQHAPNTTGGVTTWSPTIRNTVREEVVIFPGNGDSTFGLQTGYRANISYAVSIEAGDMTGDGKPEIVIGNIPSSQCNALGIYANASTPGTFLFYEPKPNGIIYTSGSKNPQDAWGPVNNQAAAGGGAGTEDLKVIDVTGDGWRDIVVPFAPNKLQAVDGNLRVWVNSTKWPPAGTPGDPTKEGCVVKQNYAVHQNPFGLAVADFNADGKPDVAVACQGTQDVSVLFNTGDPVASLGARIDVPAGHSCWWMSAGDFNNDGKLDLVTSEFALGQTGWSVAPGK